MKNKFSTSWKSSSQVRKQRKYAANAPAHIKRRMLSSNLNKTLREKYGKRSFPIRKDDEVKIMNGKFKGKKGKVSIVEAKKMRIAIEGIQRKKKDGTKINIFFNPSNVQIQTLNLEDRKRLKALNRKESKAPAKDEQKAEVKEDKKVNVKPKAPAGVPSASQDVPSEEGKEGKETK